MLFEIFDPQAAPKPIGSISVPRTRSSRACETRSPSPSPTATARSSCRAWCCTPTTSPSWGFLAAAEAHEHPRETIVSVKRFMGRGADDPETRHLGPYEFQDPKPGEPNVVRFRVHHQGKTARSRPSR